ncbi:hypothetical protein [Novosphingobium sp. P6W]|uniref:hypothetical protein n=1 Tax=Novosphingobium sp. P6W TaxID=1609758 RepID=UPI0005C30AD3|nr:hypothetical protein [Novosphingobium sp. P6W]AXB80032.1 hypothetical protein TQ38_025785 [Novosphingobium sp. P6W]KIS30358.1 hypothetical protein TQ38_22930 [Novosphingobium sp. P6W]
MISLPLRLLPLLTLGLWISGPASSQSGTNEIADNDTIDLTPQTLEDALSCRSHEALGAFATALFLEAKPPSWIRETEGSKETEGMIGLFAYRLSKPVALFGEPVTTVYFIGDWLVTLWPRDRANAFIAAQKMERAPITTAEQYYRFIDPENGPMLGAFEPTGGSTAAMLARAFGAEAKPLPPAEFLFVGCNYTPASEADFLDVARQSEAILGKAQKDISGGAGAEYP